MLCAISWDSPVSTLIKLEVRPVEKTKHIYFLFRPNDKKINGASQHNTHITAPNNKVQAFIALETAMHDLRLTPEAKAEASRKGVANILRYPEAVKQSLSDAGCHFRVGAS